MNAPLILIAEDSPDVLMVIIELLEMEGYRTVCCSDGKAAWDYLLVCNQLPNLILTDHMMPRMTGMDLCSRIRSHERFKHIPCYIYSASVMFKQAALKLACGFIAKPFDMDDLLTKIKLAIEQQGDEV